MSGGIDSSVAATLLKERGFEVYGAFMKLVESKTFKLARKRAEKVAKILKIPFFVFDLRKDFKKKIIKKFLKDLKSGITPNPCVLCNKEIKFGLLLKKALKLNFDFIATGHYARKIQDQRSKIQNLLRAKDKNKDQSYFLWMLNQKQLKRILFPIGNLKKKEIFAIAKRSKLTPALRAKKSVEICFVSQDFNEFLEKNLKKKKGKIVDQKGNVLGEHKGLWFYTIGQRKGIGLSGGPFYVLDKDFKKNLLIVTKNEKDLYKKELICKNVNWISGKEPKLPLKVKAKIRYRSQLTLAIITKNLRSKIYNLKFVRPQKAITPGQSVVFYSPTKISTRVGKGQEVFGGGIIC
jgi:tRNA-specific 2-thiouridylase